MTLPTYDGKHAAPSVFTAAEALDSVDEDLPDIPPAVILCFQKAFFERIVDEYTSGNPVLEPGLDRMYRLNDDISVVGDFGVGAGITASIIEEKAALGADVFCILGGAGCLDPSIPPDVVLLATHAIRDEGPSYHYLPPDKAATPNSALVDCLAEEIVKADIPARRGPTWTIDAFYRETVPEVEHYGGEGVLTVEMEAATLFAVADYHGLNAAAVFSIGDYVTPDQWDVPAASHSLLPDLFEPVVEGLQAYLR